MSKTFHVTHCVGNAKYVVSFHYGEKRNKDGSPFFDVRLFSNKKLMERLVKSLQSQGYEAAT